MRIYKTSLFAKWARKEKLTDSALRQAVAEMEAGLVDADLGGNVFKKRIATKSRGKRAGVRTVIAFRHGDKAFFILGYAKNKKETMTIEETQSVKEFACNLLDHTTEQIQQLINHKSLIEVRNEE